MGVSRSDALVERASQRLRKLSNAAARRGGMAQKLARPLGEDAAFLRKLKPTLVKARIKGELPTDGAPQAADASPPTAAPQPKPGRGANPFAVIGAAAGAGLALAKLIDWRGHAHPRR